MLNRSLLHTILYVGTLAVCQTMHSAAGPKLSTWWQSAQTKAAFVLPYYYNRGVGQIYYIFGEEKGGADKGTYSPFGGEANSGESHPVVTAAREAMEELNSKQTLDLDQTKMQGHLELKNGNTTDIVAKKSTDGKYAKVIYVTRFTEAQIKQQLLKKFKGSWEIGNLVEVREDRLLRALVYGEKGQPIKVKATVWKNGKCQGNKLITLRPITHKLTPLFSENKGTLGQDKRIHFY